MLILLPLLSALSAADADPAQIKPTIVDRIQGFVDPLTGKVERLEVYDANELVDSAGNSFKTPLRMTVIIRSNAPALFAALDAALMTTTDRDAAHRAKKAAEAAAALPK